MATNEKTQAEPAYRDPSRPVSERVHDLLGRMTLEEKVAQTACPFAQAAGIPDREAPPDGLGGSGWPVSSTGAPPRDGAALVNRVQRALIEGTRLGIPTLVDEEALCGLKVRGATVFPDALAQAATWDPETVEEMARAIGDDMVAIGVRQALSPLCDVARDPRWGRITETYGEDPYLVGCTATAFVRGLQGLQGLAGLDPRRRVIATLKHFVAYGASEGGRNTHPAHVGPRVLREVYGLPFEMAIRLGGVGAVMCSYNQIDGVPVQCSHELLTELLRDEYGFEGILISDLNSAPQLFTDHGVAADVEEAAVLALSAGLDLELASRPFTDAVLAAVQDGRLDEAVVDRAVANVLRSKFRLGLFEHPYVDEGDVPEVLDSPVRRALARRVAERAVVLLRNVPMDGVPLLPLGTDVRSIAVIGPNADRSFGLLGNYSYPVLDTAVQRMTTVVDATSHGADGEPGAETGSRPTRNRLTSDDVVSLVESVPIVTVLEGIRARAGDDVEVRYAPGCPIEVADPSSISEAAAIANAADVAVVVVGDQSGIFEGATVGESVDSTACDLPGMQRQLVEAVVATGTPTVVVLTHGRPFVLDWMAASVPAIVSAWFPGEEGGSAVASVLFGDVSPGGKTPVSFPRHAGVLPLPYNRTHGRGAFYFDRQIEPVFPFGHGLSYTTFEYGELRLSAPEVPTDGSVAISCVVTNTGERPGDEVVQLYTRDPVARSSRPRRELKGFRRVPLEPGASAEVTFELAADRVALWDPAEGWVVEPGLIEVMVGSSSDDIRLRGQVTLVGEVRRVGRDRALRTPAHVASP